MRVSFHLADSHPNLRYLEAADRLSSGIYLEVIQKHTAHSTNTDIYARMSDIVEWSIFSCRRARERHHNPNPAMTLLITSIENSSLEWGINWERFLAAHNGRYRWGAVSDLLEIDPELENVQKVLLTS